MNGCHVPNLKPLLNLLSDPQKAAVIAEKSKCFIATAAFGSDQAESVVRLREFRDLFLRRSWPGRRFIAAYERCFASFGEVH